MFKVKVTSISITDALQNYMAVTENKGNFKDILEVFCALTRQAKS